MPYSWRCQISYNGSGTFNINTAGQPVVLGTLISATVFNALTTDLGTGLSTAITKDGQTTTTAVIPFAAGISVGSPGITGPAGNTTTLAVHTRQVFLTGSAATYTKPANCTQLVIRAKGGGGGGGNGSPNIAFNSGTVGGTTSFNSITALGGAGGVTSSGAGGGGGGPGAGTASVRIGGAFGSDPSATFASGTNASGNGGSGGGQGAGRGGVGGATGLAAFDNSGGGGGGGGIGSAAFATFATYGIGPGGGEGEYMEIIINTPASTYTYTVGAGGAGGAAGTSGFAGGAGGSGYIVVDEYY